MKTLLEQLEHHHLFRRIVILMLIGMCWHALIMSFDLAEKVSDSIKSGIELAAVLGSIQAILTLVLGKGLSLYNKSRLDQKERREADK